MIIASSRGSFSPREEAMKTEYIHPVAYIKTFYFIKRMTLQHFINLNYSFFSKQLQHIPFIHRERIQY